MRPTAPLAAALLASFATSFAFAARAADVELDHFPAGAIKLDGKPLMSEWPTNTGALVTVRPTKSTAAFNLGYDEGGFWIGADVAKPGGDLVRTKAYGDGEDSVVVDLAIPKVGSNAGYATYSITLFAGTASVPGLVKVNGANVSAAKIAEQPRKGGGYTLEAFVPWSALGEGKKTHVGMRGMARAIFSDGGEKATSSASSDAPGSWPRLAIEPEQSLSQALAQKKLSWSDVKYDLVGDFAGDATNERVLVAGSALFFLGPTYKGGHQWLSMDLGNVASIEARDVTLDGHLDLLVTTRAKAPTSTREALHVWTFAGEAGAETPQHAFSHETLVDGAGTLKDDVVFGGSKGKPTAIVKYEAAKGWDVASYKEPIANDVDPILFPWGAVKERHFAYDAGAHAFKMEKEVAQKGAATTTVASTPSTPTTTAMPSTPSGSIEAALVAFKKERGIAASEKPRFTAAINVGSKQGEAALFGRDLVLATDGGYAFVSMQRFAADKDVLEMKSIDLTGDGRDEIVVRGVVHAKLTKASGDEDVQREVIVVYAPKAAGSGLSVAPVFAAEVARSIGSNRVEASVSFVPAKGSTPGKIVLSKGTIKGWTQATWPFGEETAASDLAPLVLPWSPSSATYAWKSDKFVSS